MQWSSPHKCWLLQYCEPTLFLLTDFNVTDPELRPRMMDPIRHMKVSNARRRFGAPQKQANPSAAAAATNTNTLL